MEQGQPFAFHLLFEYPHGRRLPFLFFWKKHQPRAVFALFGHGYALQKDKLVRNLEQNACTVASLVVGTLGAAVLHVLKNRKRRIDQLMRLVPVNVHNHPHAASVVLVLRTVQTAGTVTIPFIDNSTFHSYSLSFCN